MLKTILMLVLAIVIALSLAGCRTAQGLAKDAATVANVMADALEKPAKAADQHDANRQAKWLMIYNARTNGEKKVMEVYEPEK